MSNYTYANLGSAAANLAQLETTTPVGGVEPVSILDDAIRQIKLYLNDATYGPLALINSTPTSITSAINTALSTKVFPVGSLYTSVSSANPNAILGFGTWVQITDAYLAACNSTLSAGSQAGTGFNRTLTTTELPAHSHTDGGASGTTGAGSAHRHFEFGTGHDTGTDINSAPDNAPAWQKTSTGAVEDHYIIGNSGQADATYGKTSAESSHTHTFTVPAGTTGSAGTGAAFDIKPTYFGLYIYQRTA